MSARSIFTTTCHRLNRWFLAITFLATLSIASANNNMRDWKLASGESYLAELVPCDEAKKLVTLRMENQAEIRLDHDALSALAPRLAAGVG